MTVPLPLVDTHAHVHFDAFDADRDAVLARAREAGIRAAVIVGTDAPTSATAVALAAEHDWLFATAGIHPHDAAAATDGDLAAVRALAMDGRVVAVGETGLDYYRMLSPRDRQIELFKWQLALARESELPVVVHSRSAPDDTWEVLSVWVASLPRTYRRGLPIGVMHCFEGSLGLAEHYAGLGFAISIAGPVTYPNADDRREVVRGLPLEAFVVETDCPYLAPQAHRGQRNEPAYITDTVRAIAELRGEAPEKIAEATTANAIELFGLPIAATATERAP